LLVLGICLGIIYRG